MPFTASDICKIVLAVILPPLGVFFERGCGADLLINILLTILGYIPGIIHALYVHNPAADSVIDISANKNFPLSQLHHPQVLSAGKAHLQAAGIPRDAIR
jgi:uncharacterized membrane protein YqaE (UPF0057 family)